MITQQERAERIFAAIDLIVGDLMYHDRKDDPDLPLGIIEEAVAESNPGPAIMAAHFEAQVRQRIPLEGRVLEPGEKIEEEADGRGASGDLEGHDPGTEGHGSPEDGEGDRREAG